MDRLAAALIVAAIMVLYVFYREWQKERRDVMNRGVNQPALTTGIKALRDTMEPAILYGALIYLIIAAYYFVKFRQRCLDSPAGRAVYESDSLPDHLREALTWPQRDEDEPECLE
jgi:hypothetical protein